jgi:uncharacterized protein (DUF488 family)
MQNTDKEIFTIGHGNRDDQDFLDLLKANAIELLIDVRTYPYSKFHTQYRQTQIQASLNKAGIEYLWLGAELGGRPKDSALYIDGEVSYPAIKQTSLFKEGISKVIELVNSSIKVTLMCSESDQNQCHRKHLIANELIAAGLEVVHINKYGQLENNAESHNLNLFD